MLTESFIKELHYILKSSTLDSRKDWLKIGDYKKLPNEVDGNVTCHPKEVHPEMKTLLKDYNGKILEDIIEFHWKFECIPRFRTGMGVSVG